MLYLNAFLKDKEGKMLFGEDKISLWWAEYFEELLNVENKREELIEIHKVEGPGKEIEVEEVRGSMSGMKSNKPPGVAKLVLISQEQVVRNAYFGCRT